MSTVTDQADQNGHGHPVELHVSVNNHPVTLTERRMTGLEIKQAAKDQGAAVEVDFQLSVKHGNRYQVVGDNDPVTIREGLEFLAVAPDDNS